MDDHSAGMLMGAFFVIIAWACTSAIASNHNHMLARVFEQAYEVCEGNEGLRYINAEGAGDHKIHCSNGAEFIYNIRSSQ